MVLITDNYGNTIKKNANLNKVQHFVTSNNLSEAIMELLTKIKEENREFKEPLARNLRVKYSNGEHYSVKIKPITEKEYNSEPDDIFDKLLEFCFDCEIRDQEVTHETLQKACHFLEEECGETIHAVTLYDRKNLGKHMIIDMDLKENYAEIVDGALDTAFVAINLVTKALLFRGIEKRKIKGIIHELFHEVADSNLAKKKPDGTVEVVDGKIQKPKGWFKPKLQEILDKYIA